MEAVAVSIHICSFYTAQCFARRNLRPEYNSEQREHNAGKQAEIDSQNDYSSQRKNPHSLKKLGIEIKFETINRTDKNLNLFCCLKFSSPAIPATIFSICWQRRKTSKMKRISLSSIKFVILKIKPRAYTSKNYHRNIL